jgi:hypothetical protein
MKQNPLDLPDSICWIKTLSTHGTHGRFLNDGRGWRMNHFIFYLVFHFYVNEYLEKVFVLKSEEDHGLWVSTLAFELNQQV